MEGQNISNTKSVIYGNQTQVSSVLKKKEIHAPHQSQPSTSSTQISTQASSIQQQSDQQLAAQPQMRSSQSGVDQRQGEVDEEESSSILDDEVQADSPERQINLQQDGVYLLEHALKMSNEGEGDDEDSWYDNSQSDSQFLNDEEIDDEDKATEQKEPRKGGKISSVQAVLIKQLQRDFEDEEYQQVLEDYFKGLQLAINIKHFQGLQNAQESEMNLNDEQQESDYRVKQKQLLEQDKFEEEEDEKEEEEEEDEKDEEDEEIKVGDKRLRHAVEETKGEGKKDQKSVVKRRRLDSQQLIGARDHERGAVAQQKQIIYEA